MITTVLTLFAIAFLVLVLIVLIVMGVVIASDMKR